MLLGDIEFPTPKCEFSILNKSPRERFRVVLLPSDRKGAFKVFRGFVDLATHPRETG